MSKLTIKTATEEEFFNRGRKLSKLVDQGARIPKECVISFEDPGDVLKLLTTARLAVFRAVKEQPGSITDISDRLPRPQRGQARR